MTDAGLERAEALVAEGKFGALGTVAREGGHPFATLVAYALVGPAPVLLVSDLAEHTRNLRADPRASLLVAEAATDEPLARARVTLVGRCVELPRDPALEVAYVAHHPDAEGYLPLRDFRFWRLEVETVRYVEGFGRMGWIDGAAWAAAAAGRRPAGR